MTLDILFVADWD